MLNAKLNYNQDSANKSTLQIRKNPCLQINSAFIVFRLILVLICLDGKDLFALSSNKTNIMIRTSKSFRSSRSSAQRIRR